MRGRKQPTAQKVGESSTETKPNIQANDSRHGHAGVIKCVECKKIDNETDTQFCKTCLNQEFRNTEVYARRVRSGDVEFNSIAICALCAIRNHVKKEHEVADLNPLWRKFQFDNVSVKLTPQRVAAKRKHEELRKDVSKLMKILGDGDKQVDVLMSKMKKSETITSQSNIAKKIDDHLKTNSAEVEKLHIIVKYFSASMQNVNTVLKDDNLVEIDTPAQCAPAAPPGNRNANGVNNAPPGNRTANGVNNAPPGNRNANGANNAPPGARKTPVSNGFVMLQHTEKFGWRPTGPSSHHPNPFRSDNTPSLPNYPPFQPNLTTYDNQLLQYMLLEGLINEQNHQQKTPL